MRLLSPLLAVVVALSFVAPLWAQTPAIDALRVLADQGDPDAQYEFGCMHDVGCLDEAVLSNGLEIDSMDDAEAGHWYRLAADQGHAAAQSRLGDFYHFGYGVPRDYAEAMRWYRSAAVQGGAVAQYNLGVSYAIGRGVPLDDVEAARWYRRAADQGYTVAQYNLGNLYATGRGVPQDDVEAVRWYRFAAEQGHADAQWNLGLMYEVGIGIPQDYVAAHMWLHLSAARRTSAGGNLDLVAHDRARVASKMNTGQFAEAQRLAREWIARHSRN
ncbi:uncharacterized protein METZ01_LOCUS54431 [marine metagenome]|uniref:Sel1 repeat family protein n=1 Tax=marine metagenome TaxID=408172 RepID=A0A381SGY2_9ZZZZ